MNWTDLDILSDAGVNWIDLDMMPRQVSTGWVMDVLSDAGSQLGGCGYVICDGDQLERSGCFG